MTATNLEHEHNTCELPSLEMIQSDPTICDHHYDEDWSRLISGTHMLADIVGRLRDALGSHRKKKNECSEFVRED